MLFYEHQDFLQVKVFIDLEKFSKNKMKKFRISNKKLIVKYYNCNIQKDSILNQFLNKFDK